MVVWGSLLVGQILHHIGEAYLQHTIIIVVVGDRINAVPLQTAAVAILAVSLPDYLPAQVLELLGIVDGILIDGAVVAEPGCVILLRQGAGGQVKVHILIAVGEIVDGVIFVVIGNEATLGQGNAADGPWQIEKIVGGADTHPVVVLLVVVHQVGEDLHS